MAEGQVFYGGSGSEAKGGSVTSQFIRCRAAAASDRMELVQIASHVKLGASNTRPAR